jgi:hypothetical protein
MRVEVLPAFQCEVGFGVVLVDSLLWKYLPLLIFI